MLLCHVVCKTADLHSPSLLFWALQTTCEYKLTVKHFTTETAVFLYHHAVPCEVWFVPNASFVWSPCLLLPQLCVEALHFSMGRKTITSKTAFELSKEKLFLSDLWSLFYLTCFWGVGRRFHSRASQLRAACCLSSPETAKYWRSC